MSDNKNATRNQTTGNESREQKTVGSNNKPNTVNSEKKERVPNEKVPNIGDPKRKTNIEKSASSIKNERSEDKKKFNPNK